MYIKPTQAELTYGWVHWRDSRVEEARVAYITNLVLAFAATVLRLLSRRLLRTRLQADDWLVLVGFVCVAICVFVNIKQGQIGGGRHVVLLTDPELFAKLIIVFNCFYVTGTYLIKQAILLLYRRLFGTSPIFNRIFWITTVFMILDHVVQIILTIFPCRPIRVIWALYERGQCININASALTFGIINVVIDFWILFLPIPLLWKLNLDSKRKIQLTALFSLGGFVCVGSIYRATTLRKFGHADASWLNVDPGIWAVVEVCIGIVSACLPTFRPIVIFLRRGHYCKTGSKALSTCPKCRSRATSRMGSKSTANGTQGSTNHSQWSRVGEKPSDMPVDLTRTHSWGWKRFRIDLSTTKKVPAVRLNNLAPANNDSSRTVVASHIPGPNPPPKDAMYVSPRALSVLSEEDLETGRRFGDPKPDVPRPPPPARYGSSRFER